MDIVRTLGLAVNSRRSLLFLLFALGALCSAGGAGSTGSLHRRYGDAHDPIGHLIRLVLVWIVWGADGELGLNSGSKLLPEQVRLCRPWPTGRGLRTLLDRGFPLGRFAGFAGKHSFAHVIA